MDIEIKNPPKPWSRCIGENCSHPIHTKESECLPIEPGNNIAKVKVTYKIPDRINTKMDTAIIKKIEDIGGEWYAQGIDMRTGIRDLCFDLKI